MSDQEPGNKIRDRLEALEALVDKTAKDKPSKSTTAASAIHGRDETATPRSLHSAESTESTEYPSHPNHTQSPEAPPEPNYPWDDMNDYLNPSPPDFDTLAEFTESHNTHDSIGHYSPLPFVSAPNVALPSPAMTTPQSNPFDKHTETTKPEELTLPPSLRHPLSNLAPTVSSSTPELPTQPTNSPVQPLLAGSQAPYGFALPFAAPLLPLSPVTFPRK